MSHENEKPEIILPAEPATEVQPVKKQQSFAQWVTGDEIRGEVAQALATNAGMDAKRFVAGLSEALRIACQSEKFVARLRQSSVEALKKQVLKAAEYGLDFTPSHPQVYLLLYPEPSIAISYLGQRALIERTGKVLRMSAAAAYENEHLEIMKGSTESVVHRPIIDGKKRGALIGFYAAANMANGQSIIEVLTIDEVEKLKNMRKNKKEGVISPWDTHYDEMGKKSVFRKLMKNFDIGIGLQTEDEDDFSARNAPAQEKQAAGNDLLAALKKKEQKPE